MLLIHGIGLNVESGTPKGVAVGALRVSENEVFVIHPGQAYWKNHIYLALCRERVSMAYSIKSCIIPATVSF
jgi:hypothetical protein